MRIFLVSCIVFFCFGCTPPDTRYNAEQVYIVNTLNDDVCVVVEGRDRNSLINLTYYIMPRFSEIRIFFDIHYTIMFFKRNEVNDFFDKYDKFSYSYDEAEEFHKTYTPLFSLNVKDIYLGAKPHLNPTSATCMFLNDNWEYEFLSQDDTPWSGGKGGKVCGAPKAEPTTMYILNKKHQR